MREDLIAAGVEHWKSADEFGLDADDAAHYEKMRKALLRHAQGLKATEAAKEAGVSRAEFYRLKRRTLETDAKGAIAGCLGLIPHMHVNPQRRNSVEKLHAKKALSGAFQLLLKNHPRIKRMIDDAVLKGKHPDFKEPLPCIAPAELFRLFKTACQDAEIQAPCYPFNAANQGRSALERYKRQLLAAKEAGAQAQEDFLRTLSASQGSDHYISYAKVELDGYSLDADIEIEFAGREPGTTVRVRVKRIWIIALIERSSTTCLGYSLAFGENYAASDVLAAARHSMLPWTPLTSASTIAYGVGDGFPSMHQELAYMCFDQLHMDNAMGQLSKMALTTLQRNYRAVPVFGPGAHPDARPHVEGAFAILQKAGMGAWKALKRVPFDVLRHAIDAMLAAYNNSRAPGSTSSRMQSLRDRVAAGLTMNRRVPVSERADLMRFDIVDWAKVGLDNGTRVLRWKNARYYGAGLLKVEIGDQLVLQANSQDPREINITCDRTGRRLGSLTIERRWRTQPHDLRMRKWLGNNPELRRIAVQGSDVTLALYKVVNEKGGGAAAQRKRAVAAQGLAHSNPNPQHAPALETPPAPEVVEQDQAVQGSQVNSQGPATLVGTRAIQGNEDGRRSTAPPASSSKPSGQDLRYIGSGFVSELLKNIGSF
ncbi:UNVERIFIED_ORG: hypothetical protein J2W38_007066 [Variovorax paradoxus]|nr:hypothetical protein [Variovorax paradoxus]